MLQPNDPPMSRTLHPDFIAHSELRNTVLLGASGFLLMLAYYLLRPVREALVLTQGDEEVRSYAVGAIALLLLVVIPLYGRWLKARPVSEVFSCVLGCFVLMLTGFASAGAAGLEIGLLFFVCLGSFSLLLVAQFWATAAMLFGVDSGQRAFPAIAAGLSLGAWMGCQLASRSFASAGPYGLMLMAAAILAMSLAVQRFLDPCAGPKESTPGKPVPPSIGLKLVWRNRYLLKIAILVMLLNWIESAGDFLLAGAIRTRAEQMAALMPALKNDVLIGELYGDFFGWVCLLGLLLQLLVVPRLFRRGGVRTTALLLPLVMIAGYAVVGFLPIFSAIYLVKALEASINYSTQSLSRHVMYLPLDSTAKCHGKTTIETLFWRLGDLLQAFMIYLFVDRLELSSLAVVMMNLALAAGSLFLIKSICFEFAGSARRT